MCRRSAYARTMIMGVPQGVTPVCGCTYAHYYVYVVRFRYQIKKMKKSNELIQKIFLGVMLNFWPTLLARFCFMVVFCCNVPNQIRGKNQHLPVDSVFALKCVVSQFVLLVIKCRYLITRQR